MHDKNYWKYIKRSFIKKIVDQYDQTMNKIELPSKKSF